MSDDDAHDTGATERNELSGVRTLIEQPRRDPRVPTIARRGAGKDGVGMILGHRLDIKDEHALGFSVVTGRFDVLTEARTIRAVVVLCPPCLNLPLVRDRR